MVIDLIVMVVSGLGMVILYILNINYEFFGLPLIPVAWINIPLTDIAVAKDKYKKEFLILFKCCLIVGAIVSLTYLPVFYEKVYLMHSSKIEVEYHVFIFSFAMSFFILKNMLLVFMHLLLNIKNRWLLSGLIIMFIIMYVLCYILYTYSLFTSFTGAPSIIIMNIIGSYLILFGFLYSDIKVLKEISKFYV